MSTLPSSPLKLTANYLGPIFSLDLELTKNAQHLVFPRNGTGKSFISRALRYLEAYSQGKSIEGAAADLISDEAADGIGHLTLVKGGTIIGSLKVKHGGPQEASIDAGTILHVFSEDFVHEELRERSYELDGNIEHRIAFDSKNIELAEARSAARIAKEKAKEAYSSVELAFNNAKSEQLARKALVNTNLKDYRDLSLEELLESAKAKPRRNPASSLSEFVKKLDKLKSLPSTPILPTEIAHLDVAPFDLSALKVALSRVTSPSAVSDEIKRKIDAHRDFYNIGVKLAQDHDRCPFCDQSTVGADPKAIIDAYVRYFEDEEERHKTELRRRYSILKQAVTNLDDAERRFRRCPHKSCDNVRSYAERTLCGQVHFRQSDIHNQSRPARNDKGRPEDIK